MGGLIDVREKFADEARLRWTRVARDVKRAILQDDALGLGVKLALPVDYRAEMFKRWLDDRLMAGVAGHGGEWTRAYVEASAAHGAARSALMDYDPDQPRDELGKWTLAYHGTTREGLERFALVREPDENFNPASELGFHFAKDPEVSNAFTEERFNEDQRRMRPGGHIIPVKLPPDEKFLKVDQPPYDYVGPNEKITNRNIKSDDEAVREMIAVKAYPDHPDILAGYLEEGRALPREDAQRYAKDLIAGKNVTFMGEGPYDLKAFVENFGGAMPYDPEEQHTLVRTARRRWQEEGYAGLKYVNTSPMETGEGYGVKDPTSYIVFDPKDVKGLYTGDAATAFWLDDAAPSVAVCHAATVMSLADICEDVSERVHAGVASGLASNARPVEIAKAVDQAMGRGLWRTKLLAEHSVTQAFTQATLDGLEARGVRYVGTLSERRQRAAVRDYDPNEPRDDQGRWTSSGSVTPSLTHGGGSEFVSPSVASGLSFEQARAALNGARHQAMLKTAKEIDDALDLKESERSVIGAWSDGAENSVLADLPDASWDEVRLSAAMKGYVGDQKAVLAFKQADDGDALLYQMHAKGGLADIHKRLLGDGLAFHSLAPTADGADVYVADLDGSAHDGIKRAAEDFHAPVTYQRGRAEFIGTTKEDGTDREIRDDARRAYEGLIEQSPVQRGASIWRRNRDRWSQAVQALKDALVEWYALYDAGSATPFDNLFDAARKNPQPQHPKTGQFAKAHVVAREKARHKKTGRFQKQGLTPEAQRKEELTEMRFARVPGRLDVMTQGDDRVCDVCDGISANGPYTINQARSLIPAHPNCRCLFVAAGSNLLARDYDPDEPRDEIGRWTDEGIQAFHGSSHDFEKFDAKFIGTGQGAASYGRGLYFAEAPEVAETYKHEGGDPYPGLMKEGKLIKASELSAGDRFIYQTVAPSGSTLDKAIQNIEFALEHTRSALSKGSTAPLLVQQNASNKIARLEQTLANAKQLKERGFELAPAQTGNLYSVRIHAKPEEMLDWDKPLDQQPDVVKRFFGAMKIGPPPSRRGTGEEAFRWLGQDVEKNPVYGGVGESKAALMMAGAGIKGIRYLDEKSRGRLEYERSIAREEEELENIKSRHPEGGGASNLGTPRADVEGLIASLRKKLDKFPNTHNMVIFNPDDVEITHKNGKRVGMHDAEPDGDEDKAFRREWLRLSLLALPHHQPALVDFDPNEPRNERGEWTDEGIATFHGTGANFTKFDLAHIGQGEGSQVYGHGVYLAEEPKVAEDYKTMEGGPGGGNLYSVRIHAKPDQFVDWDKPLSGQSKLVQDYVGSKVAGTTSGEQLMLGYLGMGPKSSAKMAAAGIKGVRYLDHVSRERPNMERQLRSLRNEYEDLRRQDIASSSMPSYGAPGPFGGGMAKLPSFGYGGGAGNRDRMDQIDKQMRRITEVLAKEPTHNYVVFDPSILEVTHKNGVKLDPLAAHDALMDMLADFDPDEPRDPKGRWTALSGSQGHYALISTRPVTAVKEAASADVYKTIDMKAMAAAPEQFRDNTNLFKDARFYPGMRADEVKGSTDDVAKAVKDRMVSNLLFLANKVKGGDKANGTDNFKRWAGWYDGAHKIAQGNAKTYKTDVATAAGVLAALSPQNDWNGNVYQADVVMNALANKQKMKWDQQMSDTSARIWRGQRLAMAKEIEGKTLDELSRPMKGDPSDPAEARSLILARKAMWIRTENEAHETREHREVLPEGNFGGVVMTQGKDPRPTPARWKSVSAIANAVRAFESKGNANELSEAMGDRHKVRSFYNNILDPNSKNGDVTIDTHAVGAAWLTPTSAEDVSVYHALNTNPLVKDQPVGWKASKGSAVSGVKGTYGFYAQAYREAAAKLKIQPRQLQSIVWEAKQRLFSKKQTGTKVKAAVDAVWRQFHSGELDLAHAQREVVKAAEGSVG